MRSSILKHVKREIGQTFWNGGSTYLKIAGSEVFEMVLCLCLPLPYYETFYSTAIRKIVNYGEQKNIVVVNFSHSG